MQVKKCNGKYFLTLYRGYKQNTETSLDTTLERGYMDRTDTVQKSILVCHVASDGVLQFSKNRIVFLEVRDLENLLFSMACSNTRIYSF